MKQLKLTIGIFCAALACGSAFAQTAGTVTPPVKGKGGNHQVDPNKRAIHVAIHEIDLGVKALREGLPIYSGHRANAIQYGILGRSELQVGLMEQKLGNNPAAKVAEQDNANPKGYTDQQIKNSNIKLVIGGHHFENALALLNKSNWDYEGHKASAIVDLNKALEEIKIALAPYGGPQANMPKGGFKDGKRTGKSGGGVIKP